MEDGDGDRLAVISGATRLTIADPRQSTYVVDGWNVTGDTYRMDADGYFWFLGRRDDMIVSAGYNIGAPEVENALLSHSAVVECAVVGATCEQRGQIVKAFIVTKEPKSDDLARRLQEHVKSTIAPYKYPRAIAFVEALSKTPSGKTRRTALRDTDPA